MSLGTADFRVLAGSTVTNTGKTTVKGIVGVYPGSAVVGFPPGTALAIHSADTAAKQAAADGRTAFNAKPSFPIKPMEQDLGGKTLSPGEYAFSSSAAMTGTLTLDAKGDANAVFVFRIGSTLVTASGAKVLLINGAKSVNVLFLVGSSATLGTGTKLFGTIIAEESITLTTGSSCSRAIALTGAVTLDSATISGD